MKNTHHLGAIALALIVAGGAISETGAQHRGRANVRALQVDENADGLSDGQVLRHRGGHRSDRSAITAQLTAARSKNRSAPCAKAAPVPRKSALPSPPN